jgi:hypothetical protein
MKTCVSSIIFSVLLLLSPVSLLAEYGEIQPDGTSIVHLYHLNSDADDDGTDSLNGSLYGDAGYTSARFGNGGSFKLYDFCNRTLFDPGLVQLIRHY